MTLTGQMVPGAFAAGIVTFIIAIPFLIKFWNQWFCQTGIWIAVAAIWFVLVKIAMRANEQINIDPEVTRRKTVRTGFCADIRLWALSDMAENAQQLLTRLAGVYRLFNTAEGNRLVLNPRVDPPAGTTIREQLGLPNLAEVFSTMSLASRTPHGLGVDLVLVSIPSQLGNPLLESAKKAQVTPSRVSIPSQLGNPLLEGTIWIKSSYRPSLNTFAVRQPLVRGLERFERVKGLCLNTFAVRQPLVRLIAFLMSISLLCLNTFAVRQPLVSMPNLWARSRLHESQYLRS